MKRKKVTLIIYLSILIILFLIAIITKKSIIYYDNVCKADWSNYQVNMIATNDIYYSKINNLSDILENSSIILKVRMSDDREILNQCVLSEVIVKKIYKNNLDIVLDENKSIYIYEPFSLQENFIYLDGGYVPMNTDEEYIVFLKPLKVPEGYTMSNKEKISFMYCNPIYGKRSVNNDLYYITQDNENLNFDTIKSYNAILKSENLDIYNQYNNFIKDYK